MKARHLVTGRTLAVKLLTPGTGRGIAQRKRLLQVAESYPALLMRILNDPFLRLRGDCLGASDELEVLVTRATSRERSERFASAMDFRAAVIALA